MADLNAACSAKSVTVARQLVLSLIFFAVSLAFSNTSSLMLKIYSSFAPSKAAWIAIAVAAPPAAVTVMD